MSAHDKLAWLGGVSCGLLVLLVLGGFITLLVGSRANHSE